MKKIYKSLSIIAMVAACNAVMAQAPTLSPIVVPQIGYTYIMAADTTAADLPSFTVTAGSASAQTWNYTSQFATIYPDSAAFVAPSSGPSSSSFPNATMASKIDNKPTWIYWVGGSTGLYVDGLYTVQQSAPVAIDVSPNPAQIPVPFTYGNTVTTSYQGTATVTSGTITANISHQAMRITSADAFGTITTPTGTYNNVLRIKTYEETSDSVYVFGFFYTAQYDTTTNYTWVQNTMDAQIMSIDLDHTGAPTKARYMQSFNNSVATISQPTATLNVFPNPASDMTYFTYENKSSGMVNLQLVDMLGNQVAQLINEQQSSGAKKAAINLTALHLTHGIYFLQLTTSTGLQTIKLSVN